MEDIQKWKLAVRRDIKMKELSLIIFLITFFTNFNTHAQEDIDPQGILAIAKIAGSCGVIASLIRFQEETQMKGGDDFIDRFVSVEAARRGLSIEGLSKQCVDSIMTYDNMWKSMDASKK